MNACLLQGQLSGDRANLFAWLKVLGPLVYGQLYVRGAAASMPQAPFYLNAALTLAALCLGPFVLAADAAADGASPGGKSARGDRKSKRQSGLASG